MMGLIQAILGCGLNDFHKENNYRLVLMGCSCLIGGVWIRI